MSNLAVADRSGSTQSRSTWVLLSLLLCVSLMLLVNGCGYQLRGAEQREGVALPFMRVAASPRDKIFKQQLVYALKSSGFPIVKSSENSQRLVLHGETLTQKVVSVDRLGKSREHELHYQLSYSLYDENKALVIDHQVITRRQDYLNDEINVLGKSLERDLLKKEMRKQAIAALVRRLIYIHQAKKDAGKT